MAGKIQKLGLVKRIEEILAAGTTTSEGISAQLKAEGFSVSQPTVARWLKHTREERREETAKILSDHVQEKVPADLEALEDMEALTLAWAKEENAAFAHRLAARHIGEALPVWLERILSVNPAAYADPKEYAAARSSAIADIMQQCLLWISDEFAIQKARLAAMRQASSIIEMKLRFAGLIGEKDGNVFILGSEDRLQRDAETGRFLVIKGGADG